MHVRTGRDGIIVRLTDTARCAIKGFLPAESSLAAKSPAVSNAVIELTLVYRSFDLITRLPHKLRDERDLSEAFFCLPGTECKDGSHLQRSPQPSVSAKPY